VLALAASYTHSSRHTCVQTTRTEMDGGMVALASNKLGVLDEVKSRASPVGGKPTAAGLASVVRLTWVILIQYLIRSLMRIETNRAYANEAMRNHSMLFFYYQLS